MMIFLNITARRSANAILGRLNPIIPEMGDKKRPSWVTYYMSLNFYTSGNDF